MNYRFVFIVDLVFKYKCSQKVTIKNDLITHFNLKKNSTT